MWIAGVHCGHNSGVCLLKDGEIVFSIEEERLSRYKYDDGPFLSLLKIKEYTDKLDYLVFSGQHLLNSSSNLMSVPFTGEHAYISFARKLGLIDTKNLKQEIVDLSSEHHLLHAASAFYKSGFESAVVLVSDGSGSFIKTKHFEGFEQESIFVCEYPNRIDPLYKHIGGSAENPTSFHVKNYAINNDSIIELMYNDIGSGGIAKAYEAVTYSLRFHGLEAGKVMGLSPYGNPNADISNTLVNATKCGLKRTNKNFVLSRLPGYAGIDDCQSVLDVEYDSNVLVEDLTTLQSMRDLAYKVQVETQEAILELIYKAVEMSGKNKVVLSGGYGMNCVANYFYLDKLNKKNIEFFVDPVCNDSGLAEGAALIWHYAKTQDLLLRNKIVSLYRGPKNDYDINDVREVVSKYDADINEFVSKADIVKLLKSKNIVALYQGRSENGPRALGNRSLLFDPTFEDGKDFVNRVKRREYFRPFAGSILHEHAHEWFDMKGLEESPFMMYAMNCNEGYAEKIPSIIHVDGTCRIQTVKREQNPHYYDIIEEFYNQSGIPIIFNTSFNLGGEPLVETLDDAVRTLANSDIEYLYLPEFEILITVQNRK